MENRRLGSTAVLVSPLGCGGATLGDIREPISEAQSDATIERAFDEGITYFDTAPWYGLGKSEHRFGRALRSKPRDSFVVSTKVGRLLVRPDHPESFASPTWPYGLPFEPRFDYSAAGLIRSYEDSLQRLGLNRIDALLIHDLDFGYQRDEAGVAKCFAQLEEGGGFAALAAMRSRGEIGAIGAGINTTGFIPRFLSRFEMDFFLVAMPYTLLSQEALDEFELCRRRGVSVVIGAPFASGLLVGGTTYAYSPAPSEMAEKAARIGAICVKHDVPVGAATLQFVLAHPVVASVIPGANSPEQVRANVEWADLAIPGALWEELRAAGLLREEAAVPA